MTSAAGVAVSVLRCEKCGVDYDERDARVECDCGGLLEVQRRIANDGARLRLAFDERVTLASDWRGSGVWRYRELVLPSVRDEEIVSHPEGSTPLVRSEAVARWVGMEMRLKHEGHNPTGSFKDRGMTVGVSHAKRIGVETVACASTGNTSASLASYAALAGLRCVVFVPAAHVSSGKLAQALAYGARTLLVRGDFDACLTLARRAAKELGVYLLNSVNPFRLEGQKTIVFELLQQLDWRVPDWIVLPAGNLGNTAAFGKALREARDVGLIDVGATGGAPRIAAVQAAGAAPFAMGFLENFAWKPVFQPETVATAIRIGAPASWDRAVRTIRETNGVVIAVNDDEILEAKAVIDAAGIGCEPASAASVAGVRKLVRQGVIRAGGGDSVVAILTGHMLKDPAIIAEYHQQTVPPPRLANRPVEIEPDLRTVERALKPK